MRVRQFVVTGPVGTKVYQDFDGHKAGAKYGLMPHPLIEGVDAPFYCDKGSLESAIEGVTAYIDDNYSQGPDNRPLLIKVTVLQ